MSAPETRGAPPSGGGRPPAPPLSGEPERGPDPRDPGPPVGVYLDGVPLGDLGHPEVDAQLITAVLLSAGEVGGWLSDRGVRRRELALAFPGSRWPLASRLSWSLQARDPAVSAGRISVRLGNVPVGHLGTGNADARLLWAIAVRDGRVGRWLRDRGVDAALIEAALPGAFWL